MFLFALSLPTHSECFFFCFVFLMAGRPTCEPRELSYKSRINAECFQETRCCGSKKSFPKNKHVIFRRVESPKNVCRCYLRRISSHVFGPYVSRLFHLELISWLHLCLHKSGSLNQQCRTSPSSGRQSNYTQNVYTNMLMKLQLASS